MLKKVFFPLLLALINTTASASKPFIAVTSEPHFVKEVPPKIFDAVKPPVTLGALVFLWGPAYADPWESVGLIHWQCSDGRSATAHPGTYRTDDLLTTDGKNGIGWLHLSPKPKDEFLYRNGRIFTLVQKVVPSRSIFDP